MCCESLLTLVLLSSCLAVTNRKALRYVRHQLLAPILHKKLPVSAIDYIIQRIFSPSKSHMNHVCWVGFVNSQHEDILYIARLVLCHAYDTN
jgi:hypothetical protein